MNVNYNKLVRDRVPELIQAEGKRVIVKHLNQAEKFEKARLKLYEELKEYEDCVVQNRSAEVCNGNVHNSALLF
jgi:predicted house-cleaning noncanonical NTP pyrophosphatase (MazG superfamily)